MEDYLKAMSWKDRFGFWDFKEVAIDVGCMVGLLVIVVGINYVLSL